MTRKSFSSPTLAETAHSTLRAPSSARGTLAGLTALAVGVALILGTALPVSADRTPDICARPLVEDHSRGCLRHP